MFTDELYEFNFLLLYCL